MESNAETPCFAITHLPKRYRGCVRVLVMTSQPFDSLMHTVKAQLS